MTNLYSLDIYRTCDAILIHDKPGGWKRALPYALLGLGLFVLASLLIFQKLPVTFAGSPLAKVATFLFIGVLLPLFLLFYAFLRAYGHNTLLIDRDSIRNDWWCSFWHTSRIYPRPETIQAEACPGDWDSIIEGWSFGAAIIGKEHDVSKTLRIFSLPNITERKWLLDEIARFLLEVTMTLPVDGTQPITNRRGEISDLTFGKNLLDSLDLHGKRLLLVVPNNE